MKYRFEETLTWVIPGFYCLLYTLIIVCNLLSSSIEMPEDKNSIGVYISILVFTIPMLSLIVGWIIDAYAGYLFRYIMKRPIRRGYYLVYRKEVSTEVAEEEFDNARDRIDLKEVDRFYYRYVFSRNMYTTQIVLLLITLILLIISKAACNCGSLMYLVTGTAILLLFIPIVARDLTTHVKYVLLEDKTSDNEQEDSLQNNTQQTITNQN